MTTNSYALELLSSNLSVADRAAQYLKGIERDVRDEQINAIEKRIEKLEEKVFELADFSLETDANAGKRAMTQADATARFNELVNTEYELKLLNAELKARRELVEKYFANKPKAAKKKAADTAE